MNHDIGYRQGMNEIAAVIIYYGLTEEETLDRLALKEFIEADCYYIFDRIMSLGLEDLYSNSICFVLTDDPLLDIPNLDRSKEEGLSMSVRTCHYIFHRILPKADYELYLHILKNKIEPQLFLLR